MATQIHIPKDLSDWKKPWTKEQIKTYFIYGDNINPSELAKLAGKRKEVVLKMVKNPDWIFERELVIKEKIEQTLQNYQIQQQCEQGEEYLKRVLYANIASHELSRKLAEKAIKLNYHLLKNADKNLEGKTDTEIREALDKVKPNDLNYWNQILTRSTDAITRSLGLDYYTDLNAAFIRLESEGYKIINPNDIQNK